ncbi:MAG: phosphate-starvation-inducible PsiE family protein [Coriobacteriia bacterium]|nr:phosphate-starvation-inducible PsiE family protein [Coriobacteriia bacterium]
MDESIDTLESSVKYMNLLNRVVLYIEGAVTVLLVILAALGVVDIVLKMLEVTRADGFMTPEGITRTIDTVLVVFIVIELIRIAVSYMQHKNVIGTVLEAGLVAVVRKLVIFESGEGMLEKAIALAILILAVGVTWYLLQRGKLCSDDPR